MHATGTRIFQAFVLMALVAAGIAAGVGYRQLDDVQTELAAISAENQELDSEVRALEAEMGEVEASSERTVTQVIDAVDDAVEDIRGSVARLESETEDIAWRVDDVEYLVTDGLEELGRCLYFEAIQARYTYWYEDGFNGRYVTSCS